MSKLNIQEMIDPIMDNHKKPTIKWKNYIELKQKIYNDLNEKEIEAHLISEANWMIRNKAKSCDQFKVKIRVGDICYIDFGPAYINEIGFQHFGLILSIMNNKAFIVPMTSNGISYEKAYDEIKNPGGKKHLMKIGQLKGMYKESVLFLNDCKYINTARIIDVKAHLSPESKLFKMIRERIVSSLFE